LSKGRSYRRDVVIEGMQLSKGRSCRRDVAIEGTQLSKGRSCRRDVAVEAFNFLMGNRGQKLLVKRQVTCNFSTNQQLENGLKRRTGWLTRYVDDQSERVIDALSCLTWPRPKIIII
jgi:hypothetical protein